MDTNRILVVDDEEAVVNMCERALKKEGYTVSVACNGEKAIEEIKNAPFEIVLTDLMMPGSVDGSKLLEFIKDQSPSTDVVIMTAMPKLETAIPAMKKGAFDYLIKPIDPGFLVTLVKRCLEKRRLSEELNQEKALRLELQAAYSELQKVEHLKDAFISRLSHELRTPLATALPASEMLYPTLKDPRERKIYEILRSGLKRMQSTVENLLIFSDMQGKYFSLSKNPTDLKILLEKIVNNYRLLWEEKQLEVVLSIGNEMEPLSVDADLMETAFKHLFINAIQFNKRGGKIEVTGEEKDDQIHISFCDTGIGVPDDKLANIFDSFYQVAEYLTREVDGLGLGLAIVRKIIEAHGGNINVRSQTKEGCIFTVILPRRA